MQILPGIIFLLLPFLFLGIYKFEYILVFTIVFHFIIAVITQSLHVFNYPTIITIYTVVTFFALWKIWERKINPLKKLPQLDWTLIVVAIIALICLGSVHYNYSGKYSILSTNEPQQIKGMVYPYPYYADEWYSVSFIKETIASESLPLSNPLAIVFPPFYLFLQ